MCSPRALKTNQLNQAQHTVHQGLVEVDVAQHVLQQVDDRQLGEDPVQAHDAQRAGQGDHQQTDGRLKLEPAVVDVTENRRQRHQHGNDIK